MYQRLSTAWQKGRITSRPPSQKKRGTTWGMKLRKNNYTVFFPRGNQLDLKRRLHCDDYPKQRKQATESRCDIQKMSLTFMKMLNKCTLPENLPCSSCSQIFKIFIIFCREVKLCEFSNLTWLGYSTNPSPSVRKSGVKDSARPLKTLKIASNKWRTPVKTQRWPFGSTEEDTDKTRGECFGFCNHI